MNVKQPTRSKSTPSRHGAGGDAIVGAVCTTSLSAPGSPVITPVRGWSDDAPPGEQPGTRTHFEDMELRTKLGTYFTKDGELGSHSTYMASRTVDADCMKHQVDGGLSTSAAMKCKGKYRIRVKGPACECCKGT